MTIHHDPRDMRRQAQFLRHIAEVAKRADEEAAAKTKAEPAPTADEEEDEDKPLPLHERLIRSARALVSAANELEEAAETADEVSDERTDLLKEAQKLDWYDDAFEGFCDGMAAADRD